MKNGKKPTRKQKEAIQHAGLNPENWLVSKVKYDELVIVHRNLNQTKNVYL